MLIFVRLANGAVRRACTMMDSVTRWFAKTSEAKRRGRSIRIIVGRKPAGLESSFRVGTRARRALAQTLFFGNNVRSSARNHAIRESRTRIGSSATRAGNLRDEWILRLAHSRVLRQAWGLFIVYVVFSCRGGHKWDGGRLFCRHLSLLRRGVVGVVTTWGDWRLP